MNNWLRGTPFNLYHDKAVTSNSLPYGVDHVAAFNAFVRHWQQIVEIFDQSKRKEKVSCDDVTAVINHFGQMINFLLVDLRRMTSESPSNDHKQNNQVLSVNVVHDEAQNGGDMDPSSPHTPIFDHFLGERVLQSILQWSVTSGEFFNILQLEQLKVYEMLLSNSHPEILVYKPITEPLLVLLESCSGCVPVEVEKRLVVLLNQLWVSLMHNQHLLKYFFLPSENNHAPKFLIFSLLLPFIHREGGIGQQARDALLLSMTLSATHSEVADYIFQYSNFCPVLAAGLSGLYSMLPRSINIRTEGWYRISSEDVVSIPPLQMFINSLGFCNAIVQIAHSMIQKQLVDYLYQGFLVPVVGPALIQSILEEVVAAIVYIEFFLQSVTEEKLRRAFLALLLSPQEYSELPLLTSIISHLHSSNVQLNLVTLNLFNTLIHLHSEDTMIALVFQYLTPCSHVMLSQRSKLSQPPFSSADRFLRLLPSVCQFESTTTDTSIVDTSDHRRPRFNSLIHQSSSSSSSPLEAECSPIFPPSFSLYLKEAKWKVAASDHACSPWVWPYNAQSPLPTEAVHLINASKLIPIIPYTKPRVHSDPCSHSLPYENAKVLPESSKQRSSSLPNYTSKKISPPILSMKGRQVAILQSPKDDTFPKGSLCAHLTEEEARLDSLGESSGYESFNLKGSRDSSPLHNNRPRVQNEKMLSNGSLQELCSSSTSSEKWTETDEGFLQFLDQSQIPLIPNQGDDYLQFIDDFYETVGGSCLLKKFSDHLSSEEQDLDLQSPWVGASLSSADEESNEENKDTLISHPKPSIGPFLEALINQIDNLFTSNTDASLLAMSCISNLASYPCPLLTSLLLQPSVVLQPAVRSLYQVLGQLKQKIDGILTSQDLPILIDARHKFNLSLNPETPKEQTLTTSSFVRGNEKRRSFSQTVSAFFKRTPPTERNSRRETLEKIPDGTGYRYINAPSSPSWNTHISPFINAPIEKRQAAICAILLQEWLLELAALAEEHTVNVSAFRFRSLPNGS